MNDWIKRAEVDAGRRGGVPTELAEKMKALERENRELRQANEILRKASAYFAPLSAIARNRLPGSGTELDRLPKTVIAFIDENRGDAMASSRSASVLPIAPSTYYDRIWPGGREPDASPGSGETATMILCGPRSERIWDENFKRLWRAQDLASAEARWRPGTRRRRTMHGGSA